MKAFLLLLCMLDVRANVPQSCIDKIHAEIFELSEDDERNADLDAYLMLLEECKKFDEPFDYDGYCYLFHDLEPGETITIDVDMDTK